MEEQQDRYKIENNFFTSLWPSKKQRVRVVLWIEWKMSLLIGIAPILSDDH